MIENKVKFGRICELRGWLLRSKNHFDHFDHFDHFVSDEHRKGTDTFCAPKDNYRKFFSPKHYITVSFVIFC